MTPVYPTYGSSTVIFELGLALNGAIPAAYLAFGEAQRGITNFVESYFRQEDPHFTLDERKRLALTDAVYSASRGLRLMKFGAHLLSLFFLLAIVVSFIGIVIGAVAPDTKISREATICLAVAMLLALPGSALGYGVLLKKLEQQLITAWSIEPHNLTRLGEAFEASWKYQPQIDQFAAAARIAQVEVSKAEMDFWKLRTSIALKHLWYNLCHPIGAIKLWWLSRRE